MNRQNELAFYGDDFTGSTDVLESLSLKGKKTVLWLRIPDNDELAIFSDYECIGLAGVSRSKDQVWMKEALPNVFQFLKSVNPSYVHYKVCSTFDSNVNKGNIALAMKIGIDEIQPIWTSIVVGTPKIKRYVCYGELFADFKGTTYRIDQHPVMRCHPATPMNESNLVKHMSNLGYPGCRSLNMTMYEEGHININPSDVVIFDSYNKKTQQIAGDIITKNSQSGIHFSVSSSGFEDAIYSQLPLVDDLAVLPEDKVLALSGSCSSITMNQINNAIENGFEPIKIDVNKLFEKDVRETYQKTIVDQCFYFLSNNKSPLVYSALGPKEESIQSINDNKELGFDKLLGEFLGKIASDIINTGMINRLAVAGGDTSGYCIQSLNIDALTFKAPFYPGVPLCLSYSKNTNVNGLEVVLKGGQMGDENFFLKLISGDK